MTNKNLAEARRWFDQAMHDLAVARWDFEGEFWSDVCYLCQQASEKVLKAFLYSTGARRFIGHSLLALSKRCARHDKAFNDIARACRRLDRCYISARYPNGVPSGIPGDYFDKDDAEEALVYAESIITLVRSKVAFATEDEESSEQR
jgi:HEPN domain-containing protein